jgi:TRAP-type C4-dicarboxylate transport system permease large subunit
MGSPTNRSRTTAADLMKLAGSSGPAKSGNTAIQAMHKAKYPAAKMAARRVAGVVTGVVTPRR